MTNNNSIFQILDKIFSENKEILDKEAIKRFEECSGYDKNFMISFIDEFLRTLPENIQKIKQSLDDGDSKTLCRLSHITKTNAATLGAIRLSSICKDLENIGKKKKLKGASRKVSLLVKELESTTKNIEALRRSYEAK